MKKYLFSTLFLLLSLYPTSHAQDNSATEDCSLSFGTNMSGLADWGTELPFVDLMHNARTWYTKDVDNPEYPWNSEQAQNLSYRPDGYPTHIPQEVNGSNYLQEVATVWAITDGWPAGEYTILWDGTGNLDFWGTHESHTITGPNRAIFQFPDPIDGIFEIRITSSDIDDPVHNIRVLMPGTEETYLEQPFYEPWINQLSAFPSVRFMDWGQTNNWGENGDWDDPSLFDWTDRSQMDHNTWAYNKGIPYEMMVQLLNDYDMDGWVCIPHRASDDYIREMAEFFKENLEPERHLTVEYSNEVWNWIFGQTHWLNKYGCIATDTPWPEGIAPYVQNCLDIWTEVFADEPHRITRAVGAFTGWTDITYRIVENLTPGSFDEIAATYYFGLPEAGDVALDALGSDATVEDVAFYARQGMEQSLTSIQEHIDQVIDPLGLSLSFYEGGQHLTPHPFGQEPTYSQALIDIQRDPVMYELYTEWFEDLSALPTGEEPMQLMNFSFIGQRSARYGSWGILEFIDQDLDAIPAPKYSAIMDYMEACENLVSTQDQSQNPSFQMAPNPAADQVQLTGLSMENQILLLNHLGQTIKQFTATSNTMNIDLSGLPAGLYYLQLRETEGGSFVQKLIKQ